MCATSIGCLLMIGAFGAALGVSAASESVGTQHTAVAAVSGSIDPDGSSDQQAVLSTSTDGNSANSTLVATAISKRGFFENLIRAYADDWKGTSSGEEPKFRGYGMDRLP